MAEKEKDTDKAKEASAQKGEEAAEGGAVQGKGNNKKTLILIAAIVGVVLLIGVPLTLVAFKSSGHKKGEVAVDAAEQETEAMIPGIEEEELEEGEEALGAIFPLEGFILNLKGGGFLRAQLQLEFAERDVPVRFFTRQIPIRDALMTLLTSKSAEDLKSPEGKDALRSEVKDLINEVLKKQEVKRVYITQFVVQ